MICTTKDPYMKKLVITNLMISWEILLSDGVTVYGDYDRPFAENPWKRLKDHCKENSVIPVKVQLSMFGAHKEVFFENPDGLDGLYIFRGVAKEQSMSGDHSRSFQTLTVGLLREDCSCVDVKKYCWPENKFETPNSTRALTLRGLESMIFKNGSTKLGNEKVQELIDGTTL